MSHKVRIRPSGHAFTTEGNASVLRAGLRAGINLDHNCANGSCGQCLGRLLEGRLQRLRSHDFSLDAQQRSDGWFLMCCHRADSDLVIESHEARDARDIPRQHVTAKVSRIERLQQDVIQLSVRTPRGRGMRFLAGQGVSLHFDGMRPKYLPIASCPCDSIQLRFHVRRRQGDWFSELVFGRLKKGRELVLSGPVGEFTLDESSTRPIVFVAWESGFAPIASLIDHLIQLDPEREIQLYWLSTLAEGHYLSNYCRSWRDALDNFHYHLVDLAPRGNQAIDTVLLRLVQRHVPLSDWDLYLALPVAEQYRACKRVHEAGFPAERLKLTLLQHA